MDMTYYLQSLNLYFTHFIIGHGQPEIANEKWELLHAMCFAVPVATYMLE